MARNRQLMTWVGSVDEFVRFVTPIVRRQGKDARYNLYRTGEDNVFVWHRSEKELPEPILRALHLEFHKQVFVPCKLELVT